MAKTKSRGNGDGTIYKSEKRGWVGQITLGKGVDGRLIRKTAYAKTRAVVKEKLEKIKREAENGGKIPVSELTVYDFIESLIEEDHKMNLVANSTYARNRSTLKVIKSLDIAGAPIQQATEDMIKNSLLTLTPYSNSVISKVYGFVCRCFRVALQRDIIKKDPCQFIKRPKSNKRPKKVRALTIAEQRKFINVLNSADIDYKPQILLMMYTGMRMGEINALDLNDVNLEFNTINIRRTLTKDDDERTVIGETTKTYAGQRRIPLTSQAVAVIKDYLITYKPNKEHLLFYDYKANKVITTSQVNMAIKRALERYDIVDKTQPGVVSCHSLRHTYATRCIEGGMSAKVLQSLLGHSDIRITLNTYCDAFEDYQNKHVDVFEQYMDDLFSKTS